MNKANLKKLGHTRWEQISDLLVIHGVLSMLGPSTHLGLPTEAIQKILGSYLLFSPMS